MGKLLGLAPGFWHLVCRSGSGLWAHRLLLWHPGRSTDDWLDPFDWKRGDLRNRVVQRFRPRTRRLDISGADWAHAFDNHRDTLGGNRLPGPPHGLRFSAGF